LIAVEGIARILAADVLHLAVLLWGAGAEAAGVLTAACSDV
jgi:hypothetical protein